MIKGSVGERTVDQAERSKRIYLSQVHWFWQHSLKLGPCLRYLVGRRKPNLLWTEPCDGLGFSETHDSRMAQEAKMRPDHWRVSLASTRPVLRRKAVVMGRTEHNSGHSIKELVKQWSCGGLTECLIVFLLVRMLLGTQALSSRLDARTILYHQLWAKRPSSQRELRPRIPAKALLETFFYHFCSSIACQLRSCVPGVADGPGRGRLDRCCKPDCR